jgi:membrane protein required for colicin V production
MTGFDIVILAVVAISALLAFARGFVREALSMAAMFIAVLAVLWGFPLMRTPMRSMIETGWMADAVTIGLIFVLVYIAVRVATGRIHEWVHDSEPLGILDRTAGLLFGVARGFALAAVAALVVTSVAPPSMLPKSFKEAQFYPIVMLTADALKHLAPQAGKAATDMARGAAAAGEDLAGTGTASDNGLGNELNSSVDGARQKDDDIGDNKKATPKTDTGIPAWGIPRPSDKNRDPEMPQ